VVPQGLVSHVSTMAKGAGRSRADGLAPALPWPLASAKADWG
jgi:hypothetical protein